MVMVRIVAAAVNWVGLMVQNHCCEIRVIFLSLRNVLVCILACPFTELKIMQPEKIKGSVKDVLLALEELNKKAEDVQSSGRKANEILWSRRVQEKSLCRRRRESKKGDKKECSSCFCFFFCNRWLLDDLLSLHRHLAHFTPCHTLCKSLVHPLHIEHLFFEFPGSPENSA